MYTRCPNCETYFGVSAEQLRAAHGKVRCSRCLIVFDGLEHLTDALTTTPADAAAPITRSNSSPATKAAASRLLEEGAEPGHPDTTSSTVSHGEGSDHADVGDARKKHNDKQGKYPVPTLEDWGADESTENLPDIIKEDITRAQAMRNSKRQGLAVSVACLGLVLTLVGQYMWFHPGEVFHNYPIARPWVESWCAGTGCTLPERRDPSRVRLVTRDVRAHPKYEGALLITATMVNSVSYVQPFPQMQFTLFNVNGEVMAMRTFQPKEYLTKDVDVEMGMPPKRPVQISLDVLALEETAVSFEFQFL